MGLHHITNEIKKEHAIKYAIFRFSSNFSTYSVQQLMNDLCKIFIVFVYRHMYVWYAITGYEVLNPILVALNTMSQR
jgi:hypothetical protein